MLGALRSTFRRFVVELKPTPSQRVVARARERLRVRRSEGDVTIERTCAGDGIDSLGVGEAAVVRTGPGVYAGLPTVAARVNLLAALRVAAREAVEVHVVITDASSHLGRVAIDLPRRLVRKAGIQAAEPGDRFGPLHYVHCFFDEEAFLSEVARAGLVVAARRGATFVLVAERDDSVTLASEHAEEHADPFFRELTRVLGAVRAVEARRKTDSPQRLVSWARALGRTRKERGAIGRARLLRAIGWVDALRFGGPHCFRRVLLELALDAAAAEETIIFGLDLGRTGHVAFAGREAQTFDVAFAIKP